MMMYIRSTCTEELNGFKFKDKSIKDRMLTFAFMSDMRVEVYKGVIIKFHSKVGIVSKDSESFYETGEFGQILQRFYSNLSKTRIILFSL